MKFIHPKLGTSVTVDNRRDEVRLRAFGYREAAQAPVAQPKPELQAPVEEETPETPEEAPRTRSRSRKTDSE